ncbi:hypothetical protein LZC95_29970 [Pendulispora brunnea]|uniref:N-acetyltransferase domain-containing protein n=1 Tax=Pendulispora brunnea TaxID=2905690 RepID=A0ABZ2K0G9_9BACT
MESTFQPVAWSSDQVPWKYHRLSPRATSPGERARLREAYACWQRVWRETFRQLDGTASLFSDDFTRQDEIGALFSGEECIGLTAYRFIDLSEPSARDDSYFKVWPGELLDEVLARALRVCVGSNLTVAEGWRGNLNGLRVSEVLLELAVRRFQESDADVMLGTMRNNRGMNRVSYRLGARPLRERVVHHGVEVDLVAWGRPRAHCIWCSGATTYLHQGVAYESVA